MNFLKPDDWDRPSGYNHAVEADGRLLFVSGQIGRDEHLNLVSDKLVPQVQRTLENIRTILAEGDASPSHITRMTWYVSDLDVYRELREEIGTVYRDVIGKHYPAMTLLEVSELLEEGALVEIECTAVVPE